MRRTPARAAAVNSAMRPVDVQRLERLRAALAQDADRVHDDVDAGEHLVERRPGMRRVVEPREARARHPDRAPVAGRADHACRPPARRRPPDATR